MQKEIEKPVGPEPQIIYSTCKPAMGYTEILGRNQKWQGPEITTDFLPYKLSQNEDENKQKLQSLKAFVTLNFEKVLKEADLV